MKVDEKLVLTEVKDTPFSHATDGERNYIICGKVLLETDKDIEETKEYIKEKPYELIALIAQATAYEIIKSQSKNQEK